ncbi:MAG: LysR family transcriptional regulator [Caulobacteraceae bacterium]|nr:LysR family transcriptional regulator [Caulobacteraceae bacterium]
MAFSFFPQTQSDAAEVLACGRDGAYSVGAINRHERINAHRKRRRREHSFYRLSTLGGASGVGFGRASLARRERLGTTQPKLSNALARLRKATGDPLLIRTPEGM